MKPLDNHSNNNVRIHILKVTNTYLALRAPNTGTIEAAKTLDDVLAMLSSNYSEGTDYLQVLVFVNQKSLDPKKNPALALFYIIIPSLIINHTARLRMAKEEDSRTEESNHKQIRDDFANHEVSPDSETKVLPC